MNGNGVVLFGLPHLHAKEDGQEDWWQGNGKPHSLKANKLAQCSFQPQQPLEFDTFKNCKGLSCVAFMDGNF